MIQTVKEKVSPVQKPDVKKVEQRSEGRPSFKEEMVTRMLNTPHSKRPVVKYDDLLEHDVPAKITKISKKSEVRSDVEIEVNAEEMSGELDDNGH